MRVGESLILILRVSAQLEVVDCVESGHCLESAKFPIRDYVSSQSTANDECIQVLQVQQNSPMLQNNGVL